MGDKPQGINTAIEEVTKLFKRNCRNYNIVYTSDKLLQILCIGIDDRVLKKSEIWIIIRL